MESSKRAAELILGGVILDIQKDKKRRRLKTWAFCYAILIIPFINWAFWFIADNAAGIIMAFQQYDEAYELHWAGFENFRFIFDSLDGGIVWQGIKRSIYFYLGLTGIGLPLNLLFAFYICKKVKNANFLRFCMMIPSMVSGLVMALLFTQLVGIEGPVNYILKLLHLESVAFLSSEDNIMPSLLFYMLWSGFASTIIIYPNAMNAACSNEIIDAARVDGCSDMQEFFHIRLPLVYPTITTYVVSGVIGLFLTEGSLFAFFEYSAPSSSWTLAYYMYTQVMTGDATMKPITAALSLLLTLVVAPLTFLVRWAMEKYGPSEG